MLHRHWLLLTIPAPFAGCSKDPRCARWGHETARGNLAQLVPGITIAVCVGARNDGGPSLVRRVQPPTDILPPYRGSIANRAWHLPFAPDVFRRGVTP
jgi:hypothetical protein